MSEDEGSGEKRTTQLVERHRVYLGINDGTGGFGVWSPRRPDEMEDLCKTLKGIKLPMACMEDGTLRELTAIGIMATYTLPIKPKESQLVVIPDDALEEQTWLDGVRDWLFGEKEGGPEAKRKEETE